MPMSYGECSRYNLYHAVIPCYRLESTQAHRGYLMPRVQWK